MNARAAQSALSGNHSAKGIIKSVGLEAKASFLGTAASAFKDKQPKSISITEAGRVASKAANALTSESQKDDTGAQTVRSAVSSIGVGASVFKASQIATSGLLKTGAATWDVVTTAGKATVTVHNTLKIGPSIQTLQTQAITIGLNQTRISQAVIHGVQNVRLKALQVKAGVMKVKRAVLSSYITAHLVTTGAVSVGEAAKVGAGIVTKTAAIGITRIAATGAAAAIFHGIPTAFKAGDKLSVGIGGIMTKSADDTVRAAGQAISVGRSTLKTTATVTRFAGKTVMTTAKAGIKTANAVNYVRKYGIKSAAGRLRDKAIGAMANAGHSAVSALLDAARGLVTKAVLPIILIIAVVAALSSVAIAPLASIGAIFGGMFSVRNDSSVEVDWDMREYMLNEEKGVPKHRSDFIAGVVIELEKKLIPTGESGGQFHVIRMYIDRIDDPKDFIEPTSSAIDEALYTSEQIADILQPVLNTFILMEYELVVPIGDMGVVDSELAGLVHIGFGMSGSTKTAATKLLTTSESTIVEYCGQEIGGDTPEPHGCGVIHAYGDCLNPNPPRPAPDAVDEEGEAVEWGYLFHSSYTCEDCDTIEYKCGGYAVPTTGVDGKPTTSTRYCSSNWMTAPCTHNPETRFECTGYRVCNGHKVLNYVIAMNGIHAILADYFTNPINELLSRNRSSEEEERLQSLQDYYEICLELIAQIMPNYGGGATMADLGGVEWVVGSRDGHKAIVDKAMSQVGQIGGELFWRAANFASRVEWCATFTAWVYRENERGWPEISAPYTTRALVDHYRGQGAFIEGSDSGADIAPGDLIFFDWNGDGHAQHIGIVIGRDEQFVYTVEGNSGDAVRIRKYPLDSPVILGYVPIG
jgi:hypothetical protein